MKTKGQIAYEAYCDATNWKSAITGETLPDWECQLLRVKMAWEAAAKAVLES